MDGFECVAACIIQQGFKSKKQGSIIGDKILMAQLTKCPGCGAQFQTKEELIDHVVDVHSANCQICGAKTRTKEELLRHNKEVHGI